MISGIRLVNFKCFEDLPLYARPLTVLTGANGAGKSTVLQAILLLHQSAAALTGPSGNRLQLNGELVELGYGQDVMFKRSDADFFEISLVSGVKPHLFHGIYASEEGFFSARVSLKTSEKRQTLPAEVSSHGSLRTSIKRRINYLSADRLGPRTSYSIGREALINPLGRTGEYAAIQFQRHRKNRVINANLLLESPETGSAYPVLEEQLGHWMARMFPGFEVGADLIDKIDAVTLGFSLQSQVGEPELLRPINVGFGVSVVFPVILGGLLARRGSTLIVENPEAHLHPSAQSLLGEFLARVSLGGVQVFVETHSEHVVNGMRIAVKNGVLPAQDVVFHAFLRGVNYGSHRVEAVEIDQSGEFESQPKEFFDQADHDLKIIYGI